MAPPKRKDLTPEKGESSSKRQTLSVPNPGGPPSGTPAGPPVPSLTPSGSESPPSDGLITPRHNGTKQKSGHYTIRDMGIEYLWYECTVLVDTLGTNQPPLLRVLVKDDEDSLPIRGNPLEMDIRSVVIGRVDNWLNETVTLHFRRDTRDATRRNSGYVLVFVFFGEEGYPRGKEDFETNLISAPAQGP